MPGERTEQATQHRRDKARKEGDILHSRELSAAAGTLAGVMVLGAMGSHLLIVWRDELCRLSRSGAARALGADARFNRRCYALRKLTLALLGPPAIDDGGGGRGRAGRGRPADRRRQLPCRARSASSWTASTRSRISKISFHCAPRRGWPNR